MSPFFFGGGGGGGGEEFFCGWDGRGRVFGRGPQGLNFVHPRCSTPLPHFLFQVFFGFFFFKERGGGGRSPIKCWAN